MKLRVVLVALTPLVGSIQASLAFRKKKEKIFSTVYSYASISLPSPRAADLLFSNPSVE